MRTVAILGTGEVVGARHRRRTGGGVRGAAHRRDGEQTGVLAMNNPKLFTRHRKQLAALRA
ncbi:hypothetical protein [Saccharopolyspora sp. NPDC002686]|uniref:hypothetical protein n=1 Tax=Saccharopolyspora sp. NPDC002686 TaxID=3154541 RepID=UPI003327985B